MSGVLLTFVMWSLFKFYRDSRRRQFKADKAGNEATFLSWLVRQRVYIANIVKLQILWHMSYLGYVVEQELHMYVHAVCLHM